MLLSTVTVPRDRLGDRVCVVFWLSVEGDERDTDDDAGEIHENTDDHREPEAVQRIDEFVTNCTNSGVEAV